MIGGVGQLLNFSLTQNSQSLKHDLFKHIFHQMIIYEPGSPTVVFVIQMNSGSSKCYLGVFEPTREPWEEMYHMIISSNLDEYLQQKRFDQRSAP